jgi:hypothetical protein
MSGFWKKEDCPDAPEGMLDLLTYRPKADSLQWIFKTGDLKIGI